MKNNKGISELIILLSVVVIVAIAAIFLVLQKGSFSVSDKMAPSGSDSMMQEQSPEMSAEPVSDSTESAVIEQEIEQTTITSPLDEIEVMESEAGSL